MSESQEPVTVITGAKLHSATTSGEPAFTVTEQRVTVSCDEACGAYEDPQTFEEYKAAYEHWKSHEDCFGCSHQR